MKKKTLKNKVQAKLDADAQVFNETKQALQLVFDELNNGQQNKLLKEESIVELFDRYGVEY
jgi:hypothetical protein